MDDQHRPGRVPDEALPEPALAGPACFDTDGDGVLDTAVTTDGVDLVLLTDLDGDRFADQVLRIGPDGTVREATPPPAGSAVDGLLGGVLDPGSGPWA
jgi:hypothetical protein